MENSKFQPPENFEWGYFTNTSGAKIRYGHAPLNNAKATAIILPGFGEPAEKYFETIHDMHTRGFSCWVMDWRGQGGSERYLTDTPLKSHHNGYGEQIETLHQFTQKVVSTDKPLIMMAHSMGGHLGLRYLQEHDDVFQAAVMTSPMINIWLPFPKAIARMLIFGAVIFGKLQSYAPGANDDNISKDPFTANKKTDDPLRFEIQKTAYKNNPQVCMGGPTWGWLLHAFASIAILQDPAYLASIHTPVLIAIAGKEGIVDSKAIRKAIKSIPSCKQLDIPEAKHEIWMERDELRDRLFSNMDTFLTEHLKIATTLSEKGQPA